MEEKNIKEKNYRYIKTESEICITLHIVTVILIKNLFNERQVKLMEIILFNEKLNKYQYMCPIE